VGVKKRLNKMTEAEAKELIEQAERDGGKKPRTTTNARDEAQVRLVLGCLLTGNLYGQYERLCLAMQMEPMHQYTWAGSGIRRADRHANLGARRRERRADALPRSQAWRLH
jgi:hypothetical protein